jgi:hypothetical protein
MPAPAARLTAFSNAVPTPSPPSDMLITRAPFCRAISTDWAIAESLCLQPSFSVQLSGLEELSDRIVESNATPIMPEPLRAAAMVPETAVPCPSVSVTPRLPPTSRLAAWMRPANSGSAGLMPLSTTATITPLPVPPAL